MADGCPWLGTSLLIEFNIYNNNKQMTLNSITQKQRKDIVEEIATSTNKLIIATLVIVILNFIIFVGILSSEERPYLEKIIHRNIEIIFSTVSFILGIFLLIYYIFFIRNQVKKLATEGETEIYISEHTVKSLYLRIAISMPIQSFIYIGLLTVMGYEGVRLIEYEADFIFYFSIFVMIAGIVAFVIFIIQMAGVKNMKGSFSVYEQTVKSEDPNFIPFF